MPARLAPRFEDVGRHAPALQLLAELDGGAEVGTAKRHAAEDAGIDGEGNQVLDLLLVGDGAGHVGQAEAQVDDAVGHELHHGASGDRLYLSRGGGGRDSRATRNSPERAGWYWVP